MTSVPAGSGPGSRELLNHIYLPAGIAVPLKLDVKELAHPLAAAAGLTVTTMFCVFVQPLAVKIYT